MIYTLFPLGESIYTDSPQDFETYADAWEYAIEQGYDQYVIESTEGEVV